jgi:hypothetical protein
MARFVRQAPRLPRSVAEKYERKGSILRRSQAGRVHFTCSYGGQFSTFVVTRKGEAWLLEDLGYEIGHEIDRHIIRDLHDFGYIEKDPSLAPASRRTRSRKTVHHHHHAEVPDWLARVRKEKRPPAPHSLNWADQVGLDSRLGTIRSETVTIKPDGSAVVGARDSGPLKRE